MSFDYGISWTFLRGLYSCCGDFQYTIINKTLVDQSMNTFSDDAREELILQEQIRLCKKIARTKMLRQRDDNIIRRRDSI